MSFSETVKQAMVNSDNPVYKADRRHGMRRDSNSEVLGVTGDVHSLHLTLHNTSNDIYSKDRLKKKKKAQYTEKARTDINGKIDLETTNPNMYE